MLGLVTSALLAALVAPPAVMMNGLPGAMGREIAAACLRRGIDLELDDVLEDADDDLAADDMLEASDADDGTEDEDDIFFDEDEVTSK